MGVFCLTPDVAAARRQARQLRGALNAVLVPGREEGVTVALPGRCVSIGPRRASGSRARARGLTLAELLTEFAVAETPEAEGWPAFKAGRS